MRLLQISYWVRQWKKLENRLIFGVVMGKSLVSCFLTHGVVTTTLPEMKDEQQNSLFFSHIACTQYVNPALFYTSHAARSVCTGHTGKLCKKAEPTEMLFGRQTCVGSRNLVLDWGPDPHGKGHPWEGHTPAHCKVQGQCPMQRWFPNHSAHLSLN